tara:strand:+ start:878 stop:1240 length:363 start_codon:yes stop_codon:yes gene_type:complete
MKLLVLDYDRGDTVSILQNGNLGCELLAPSGHPKLVDHSQLYETADVFLIKIPIEQQITQVMLANLEQRFPATPKLLVSRLLTDQLWLWPRYPVRHENILRNGLHLMESIHDVAVLHKSP